VGRRVAILLDARPREDFLRGHAPGAAHLPAAEWDARTAELPPREEPVDIVATTQAEAVRLMDQLAVRGFAQARAASPEAHDDRSEAGPARAVAWRSAPALVRWAAQLPARGRALDIACGAGRDVAWLAARGLDTTGLDILPDALVRASRLVRAAAELAADAPMFPTARTSFACAAAERAPLRNASFDLVTGFRFLDRQLIASALDWLRPGGQILWETFSARTPIHCHPRREAFRLAPGELANLCMEAGFRVIEAWEDGPLDGVLARREA
jgi:SAM-dependent methyltransferase